MATRVIETDPEVLEHAVNDGINIFIRDVLGPKGLLKQPEYENVDRELMALQCSVAKKVAENWRHCTIDDAAGPYPRNG